MPANFCSWHFYENANTELELLDSGIWFTILTKLSALRLTVIARSGIGKSSDHKDGPGKSGFVPLWLRSRRASYCAD